MQEQEAALRQHAESQLEWVKRLGREGHQWWEKELKGFESKSTTRSNPVNPSKPSSVSLIWRSDFLFLFF